MYIAFIIGILWYMIGMRGFIFWWRSELDLTGYSLPTMTVAACLGPLAWIVGYFIHGRSSEPGSDRIFFKRRTKKEERRRRSRIE